MYDDFFLVLALIVSTILLFILDEIVWGNRRKMGTFVFWIVAALTFFVWLSTPVPTIGTAPQFSGFEAAFLAVLLALTYFSYMVIQWTVLAVYATAKVVSLGVSAAVACMYRCILRREPAPAVNRPHAQAV